MEHPGTEAAKGRGMKSQLLCHSAGNTQRHPSYCPALCQALQEADGFTPDSNLSPPLQWPSFLSSCLHLSTICSIHFFCSHDAANKNQFLWTLQSLLTCIVSHVSTVWFYFSEGLFLESTFLKDFAEHYCPLVVGHHNGSPCIPFKLAESPVRLSSRVSS